MTPNGYVLWEGPSAIDGEPIVLIVTGTKAASTNPKTGWMLQTWIMRSDMHPMAAIHQDLDESVCDSCPLRGEAGKGRTCYVNLATIGQIYGAYCRGNYPYLTTPTELLRRPLRLGAYGDPAAVPYAVWEPLLLAIDPTLRKQKAPRLPMAGVPRTGYTHLWRTQPEFQTVCMASVESVEARAAAKALGWRTYRVKRPDEMILPGETVCPASKEGGQKLTCIQCGLCGGTSVTGADIVINVHGNHAHQF